MTDDEIHNTIKLLQKKLSLTDWSISFDVVERVEFEKGERNETLPPIATVEIDEPHKGAHITLLEGCNVAEVLHEMTHIVLSPFIRVAEVVAGDNDMHQQLIRDANERVTNNLERGLYWSLGLDEL